MMLLRRERNENSPQHVLPFPSILSICSTSNPFSSTWSRPLFLAMTSSSI